MPLPPLLGSVFFTRLFAVTQELDSHTAHQQVHPSSTVNQQFFGSAL